MADELSFGKNMPAQIWQARHAPLLWQLLAERMERYTMGESSSVPLETAEELSRSLVFSVSKALRAGAPPDTADGQTLLRLAWAEIERDIADGKNLLHRVDETLPGVPNHALADTLRELALFFKRYDFRFFAHRLPCSIDYQLLIPVSEQLEGIDYINAYLRRLLTELAVLHAVGSNAADPLLSRVSPHAAEELMGLLEPVLDGALGKALLCLPFDTLCMEDGERALLYTHLRGLPVPALARQLTGAAEIVCDFTGLWQQADRAYLKQAARTAAPRFGAAVAAGDLRGLFPPARTLPAPAAVFIDGPAMEDGRLRALLHETAACRLVSDKIALFRRHIHSLRDADEMLSLCFWGAEQDALFDTLDPASLAPLLRLARQKRRGAPGRLSETGWETRLERRLPRGPGVL